jgi:hypothetical protein
MSCTPTTKLLRNIHLCNLHPLKLEASLNHQEAVNHLLETPPSHTSGNLLLNLAARRYENQQMKVE